MSQTVVQRLQQALPGAPTWFAVAERLRGEAKPPESDPIWPFIWAFQYTLVDSTDRERREKWGVFAPWATMDGTTIPPALTAVDDACLATWAEAIDSIEHPVGRSRLADLLWERRWTNQAYRYARSAIAAYIAMAKQSEWAAHNRGMCLRRALDIALALNDKQAVSTIVADIVTAAHASLQAPESQPGLALPLIEALMVLPARVQPAGIDEFLSTAATTYESNPWTYQSVLDLQARRARDDLDRAESLRRLQVARWRREAEQSTQLLRYSHLRTALELARVHGLVDIVADIRTEIQRIPLDELGLKPLETSIEISRHEIEQFIEYFVRDGTRDQCLLRFGAHGPPSGDYETNLEAVRERARQFPLSHMFSQVIIGPDNVPIRQIITSEEHEEADLTQQERLAIQFWGVHAADILDRIKDKHPRPRATALTAFFTTDLIDSEIAERLGRALFLYWHGEYDESAHIILPRIEAILREICRQLGIAIIREPVADKPGVVRILAELIAALEGHIDESWRRYLRNLLTDPLGLNLRNRLLHGLMVAARREDAALLIHTACFLRLLEPIEQDHDTEAS